AFSLVLPDAVAGDVVDQPAAAWLDLRGATNLFHVVALGEPGPLVQSTATARVLQGHTLEPAPATTPRRMVALAAIATTRPIAGQTGVVQDGAASITAAANGAWRWRPMLRALARTGQGAMTVPLDPSRSGVLRPGRRWTMEAWVRPVNGAVSRV